MNAWHAFGLSGLFLVGGMRLGAVPETTPHTPAIAQAARQFREFYLTNDDPFAMRDSNEPMPEPGRALEFARELGETGRWDDVDYDSQARSGWPPQIHNNRLVAMAAAAGRPGVAEADRARLLDATHRAFAWWIAHDYQCPNWWYNQIGVPKAIGTAALLLGDELSAAERAYVVGTLLPRSPVERTGQNRVWMAGNTLMRGLLAGDEPSIEAASAAIWQGVAVSTDEGVQPDHSFHQHGPQLQFGNYGQAFAVEIARWDEILRGTPWELPPERLAVYRDYLLDGLAWVSWRGAMDISSCGRQLMPHSPRSKAGVVGKVMTHAARFDPSRAADYAAYVARNQSGAANDLVGDRYFWRSDYLVHRRRDFMATLKMSSRRVIGAEVVNHENLSGYHLADGALYLYRTGAEYADIFPVWDWRKLPGVTCGQGALPAFTTSAVPAGFVGGVSDGADAVAALDYERDGVRARKAWFFAGDAIVCLGAGITGEGPDEVVTTLNQCLLAGEVRAETKGVARVVSAGAHGLDDVDAVIHDGWRYTLLEGGPLRLATGPVTGNWHRVFENPETPPADVTRAIFTLTIDHGVAPHGARYAYVIAPEGVRPRAVGLRENSPERQVVAMGEGRTGIVFWQAGAARLPDGRELAVDAPCLVLVTNGEVRVVDPTQTLAGLRVTLGGVPHEIVLPRGGRAGTAVVVR